VRHVDHEGGADLVGDLAHLANSPSGVRGVARPRSPAALTRGPSPQGRVSRFWPLAGFDAVARWVEHLAGDVRPEAVVRGRRRRATCRASRWLPSGGPQLGPLGVGEVVDLPLREALQARRLDPIGPGSPNTPPGWVDAGVRLDIRITARRRGPWRARPRRPRRVEFWQRRRSGGDGALGILSTASCHRGAARPARRSFRWRSALRDSRWSVQLLAIRRRCAARRTDHLEGGPEGGGRRVQAHPTGLHSVFRRGSKSDMGPPYHGEEAQGAGRSSTATEPPPMVCPSERSQSRPAEEHTGQAGPRVPGQVRPSSAWPGRTGAAR